MLLGHRPPDDWYEIAREDFLASVPAFARWHLDNIDHKAYLALWPLDVAAARDEDMSDADDHDSRTRMEQIGGCFFPDKGVLYASVATESVDDPDDIRIRDPRTLARILRHETAHDLLMTFGHVFEKEVLIEAVRQDIVAQGGYEAMRNAGDHYYTPTPYNQDRDILEISAEALASLWPGGGCRPRAVIQRLFPRTSAACMHFLNFLENNKTSALLDRRHPAHRALAARAQADLRDDNQDTLGLSYAISRSFDPASPMSATEAAAPVRLRKCAKSIIDALDQQRLRSCSWGVEFRDIHSEPANVAITLLQEVARLSVARDTADDMNKVWHDAMRKMPIKDSATMLLLRQYGPLLLDLQALRLNPRERAAFVQGIRDLQSPLWMQANPGLMRQIARNARFGETEMGDLHLAQPLVPQRPERIRPLEGGKTGKEAVYTPLVA